MGFSSITPRTSVHQHHQHDRSHARGPRELCRVRSHERPGNVDSGSQNLLSTRQRPEVVALRLSVHSILRHLHWILCSTMELSVAISTLFIMRVTSSASYQSSSWASATNAGELDIFHISEVGAFEGQFTPTDHPTVSAKETGDFMKVWGNRAPFQSVYSPGAYIHSLDGVHCHDLIHDHGLGG